MRSRLAIIAMLVFGMVLSTGGGALAVSGFTSQSDNAAKSQYAQGDTGDNEVLGEEESGGPAGGEENGGAPAGTEDQGTQPARQVEAGAQGTGDQQLPFTGFAAIPILLGGVALLASGLVLRKRSAEDR